jgi:hypothetical protein
MTKTRSSTMSADEIPARPTTGMGAPAVPRSTNSVPTLAWSFLAFPLRVVLRVPSFSPEDGEGKRSTRGV